MSFVFIVFGFDDFYGQFSTEGLTGFKTGLPSLTQPGEKLLQLGRTIDLFSGIKQWFCKFSAIEAIDAMGDLRFYKIQTQLHQ